jgi:hypothetical protein
MREITGSLSCTVELSTDKLLTPVPPQKVFHKSIFTDINFVKIDIAQKLSRFSPLLSAMIFFRLKIIIEEESVYFFYLQSF